MQDYTYYAVGLRPFYSHSPSGSTPILLPLSSQEQEQRIIPMNSNPDTNMSNMSTSTPTNSLNLFPEMEQPAGKTAQAQAQSPTGSGSGTGSGTGSGSIPQGQFHRPVPALPPPALPSGSSVVQSAHPISFQMMNMYLDGATVEEMGVVFGMRVRDMLKIVNGELFQSGVENLRRGREIAARSVIGGASLEAARVLVDTMRNGKKETIRMAAAERLLDRAGIQAARGNGNGEQGIPWNQVAPGGNGGVITMGGNVMDLGQVVQKAMEIAGMATEKMMDSMAEQMAREDNRQNDNSQKRNGGGNGTIQRGNDWPPRSNGNGNRNEGEGETLEGEIVGEQE
jgi:hypothetical protein